MRNYVGWFIKGMLFALGLVGTLALAQNFQSAVQLSQDSRGNFPVDTLGNLYLTNNRHLSSQIGQGPGPTLGTCTGGTLTTGSTDIKGSVSGTSGTSCVVNFGQAWTTAPFCVTTGSVSSAATTGPVSNTTSTSALTMTVAATGAGTWSYLCMGLN